MLAAFIITARESLEASLLVGLLLAYLGRTDGGRSQRGQVWLGSVVAVAMSVVIGATVIATIGGLSGRAEEASEAVVMLSAAAVLTYVVVWLHRQGRQINRSIQSKLATAVAAKSTGGVMLLSFFAVFREGVETALYLAAMAGSAPAGEWVGAGLGFGAAIAAGAAIYNGSRLLDPRMFFRATSFVLVLFGAGLVSQATLALQSLGVFPGTISLWDTSAIVPDTGTLGGILRSLFGYAAAPSLLQTILWAAYIAMVMAVLLDIGRPEAAAVYGEPFRPIGSGYGHPLYRLLRWRRLTTVLATTMAVLLVGLLAVALLDVRVGPFSNEGPLRLGPFQNPEVDNNLFNWVMWVAWLPLLSIGTMLVGRFWCGNLCPLRLATTAARWLGDGAMGKGTSTSPYLRIGWVLPTTFIVITFFVKWWPVQSVARYGAFLFLSIFLAALAVSFLFRQGTWCRFVCPIGGWLARIARLSPLGLRADPSVCASCDTTPCLRGTAAAGRCPVLLNPTKLESNRNCLDCWQCVGNCPANKAALRVGWRFPGAELFKPSAPDLWESLFVASLLGMYIATGHRSTWLASLPWPLVFFGLIALATLAYLVFARVMAALGGLEFRRSVATFGYVFLPLEFSTALIAFGDDALEFFDITQQAASVVLGLGFIWSTVIAVAIVRNTCRGQMRQLASALPIGAALLAILFVWVSWYASGTVVDLT